MLSGYLDDEFNKCLVTTSTDPKMGKILLNAEKLTKGNFNITVPLRDHYLEKQFKEMGMENNYDNRAAFYELIYSTPNLGNYTTGAVLTDELIKRPDKKF